MTKKPIPIEETAVYPLVGMTIPTNITFSQDGREIRFLSGSADDPTQKLYTVNIESGEKRVLIEAPDGGVSEDKLSPEEELRRQRLRMLATGITSYGTVKDSERLLIPLMGDIYVWDAENGLKHVLDTAGGAAALNPVMTDDGKSVAYVQDAEIYVASVETGESRQITTGARGTGKTNGLAEFVAQEELGRMDGFWWSPEGTKIAFTEVDETHIPIYRIMHQGKDEVGETAQEDHAYPFAGAENAKVRLAYVPVEGGEPVFMDTDFGEEVYFRSVFWWDETRLGAEVVNREQDKMWLVEFDRTGERNDILEETSEYWINRDSMFRVGRAFPRLKSGDFLNCSEQSGFNHIYHYNESGQLIAQLTSGDWMVDGIQTVDEEKGIIYFVGNMSDPREQHLYSVSLKGGEIKQITQSAGTHSVKISPDNKYFVDIFHSVDTPPTVTLNNLSDGTVVHTLHEPNDPRLEQYAFPPPEMVELENRDGTKLYGAIYRPDTGEAPYPTIVYVYGGPGPQLVRNSWTMAINMRAQYLRQQGFLVFTVDNRGSARRGLEFEGAIKERMGTIEVDDQVDAVNWLIEQGLTIPERVGVYGWSYGGYMTLMCLAKAPDVFKVGVSGAPVTAFDGYDTAYTERYMSTPQKNAEGYRTSNVMEYVSNIKGKLLLIHGMLDENVHFRHTARLINALIRHRIPYDLLLFPDERHMPRREADRVYLNEHLFGYFEKHL